MVRVRLVVREGLPGRTPEPCTGSNWAKGCPTPCCIQAQLGWPVLLAFFTIGPAALEMGSQLASPPFPLAVTSLAGCQGRKDIKYSLGRRRLPREGKDVSCFP